MNAEAPRDPRPAILAALPVALLAFDAQDRLILANDALHALAGTCHGVLHPGMTRAETLRQLAFQGLFGTGDPAAIAAALHETPDGRGPALRLSGGRRLGWVQAPLPGGGRVIALPETTELTEAFECAEQQLRDVNAVLQRLSSGIAVYGQDQRLRFSNPALPDLVGLGPAEAQPGTHIVQLNELQARRGEFAPGWRERLEERLREDGWRSRDDWERRRPNGQVIRIRHHPMPDGGWLSEVTDITRERDAAEDAARRIALQDALLEALPVGVAVFGPDRVLRYVNPAYHQVYGHIPVQVGEHLGDILMRRVLAGEFGPGDPQEQVAARLARVSERFSFERCVNGRTTLHRSTPLPDGGHAMVVADVSELTAAQAEILAREQLLATTLEATRHGIVMFDAHSRVILANRLASFFCGLPADFDWQGTHLTDIRRAQVEGGHLGTWPRNGEDFHAWLHAPIRAPDRYRREGPDGTVVEVITDALPGGGFVRSYSDITALARAEAEASARAGTLQTVLDSMRHGVILYDQDGRLRVANRLASRLTGLPTEALQPGVHFETLREMQSARGEHGSAEGRVPRKTQTWHDDGTYTRTRPDGTVIEVRTDLTPDGGSVRTFTDITALTEAQAEATRRNAMMQVMLENMRHGIALFDAEQRLLAANSLCARWNGIEGELHPGMTRTEMSELQAARGEFGPPELAAGTLRRLAALDFTQPQAWQRRRPDGTMLDIRANPVPEGGFVLTLTDVTARVRAEEQAKARAAVLAATLNASRHSITLFDADGRVVACNEMAAVQSGFPNAQAAVGLTHAEVVAQARKVQGGPPDLPPSLAFDAIDRARPSRYQRRARDGRVLDVFSDPVPGGGYVVTIADVTALVQAQEEAQRRAGTLQAMLDNNRHGIVLYDKDHRLVAANALAGEMMNVADLLRKPGTPHHDILAAQRARGMYADPQGGAATERGFRELDRTKPQRTQRTLPDGRRFDIASDPTPDGGFVVSIADVTALARAEAEAETRAGILQTMLENISMGILLYDRERRLVALNDLATKALGLPDLASMRGCRMEDILARQHAAGNFGTGAVADNILRELTTLDRSLPHFHQRVTADGRVLNNASYPTPDGGYVVSIADVTPLAQARAEADRRASIMGVMLDNIRHGIILFDAEGRLVAVNPMVSSMLDLPADALAPGITMRALVELLHARGEFGEGEEAAQHVAAILAHPRTRPNRNIRRRPNGAILEVVSDPTPDGGFVLTYTDVTDDRRIRDELERARTAAEAANLAKSRFLATMSHELRTPLNAVIGFSEILTGDAPREQTQEFARAIQDAGRHLLSLIDDILEVTRAESGHLPVTLETLSLPPLLESVDRMMRRTAEASQLTLRLEPPGPLPLLRADEQRLRQVLLNLIANATKFTPAGGCITLSARHDAAGLEIEVRDTGIGISAADLPRVFEPFTQLDGQLTRRYPGAGLGLYLCRVLMEAQGGTLTLDSAEGEGTRALLRFPPACLLP